MAHQAIGGIAKRPDNPRKTKFNELPDNPDTPTRFPNKPAPTGWWVGFEYRLWDNLEIGCTDEGYLA